MLVKSFSFPSRRAFFGAGGLSPGMRRRRRRAERRRRGRGGRSSDRARRRRPSISLHITHQSHTQLTEESRADGSHTSSLLACGRPHRAWSKPASSVGQARSLPGTGRTALSPHVSCFFFYRSVYTHGIFRRGAASVARAAQLGRKFRDATRQPARGSLSRLLRVEGAVRAPAVHRMAQRQCSSGLPSCCGWVRCGGVTRTHGRASPRAAHRRARGRRPAPCLSLLPPIVLACGHDDVPLSH